VVLSSPKNSAPRVIQARSAMIAKIAKKTGLKREDL